MAITPQTGVGDRRPGEMTILVDDPIWAARGRRWAHLASDHSHEELHTFAAALGLPRRAFHRDHYDLPADWWGRALAAGAEPVNGRELVRRLRDAGLRRRPGKAAPPIPER